VVKAADHFGHRRSSEGGGRSSIEYGGFLHLVHCARAPWRRGLLPRARLLNGDIDGSGVRLRSHRSLAILIFDVVRRQTRGFFVTLILDHLPTDAVTPSRGSHLNGHTAAPCTYPPAYQAPLRMLERMRALEQMVADNKRVFISLIKYAIIDAAKCEF